MNEKTLITRYLEVVLHFKHLRKGMIPIVIQLLAHKTYQNGQCVIYMNKGLKDSICTQLDIGVDSINKTICELNKVNLLRRINTGTYEIDECLIINHDDLENIQTTLNFQQNNIITKFVQKGDISEF